jgi:hypothetical protein
VRLPLSRCQSIDPNFHSDDRDQFILHEVSFKIKARLGADMMVSESYRFVVGAEEQALAGSGAIALADTLREADGVIEAVRSKANDQTMDLGTVVSVVATSGATLAIAQGLAAWLRARRGVTVTVEKDSASGSLKAAVTGIDPEPATRIVEIVRDG